MGNDELIRSIGARVRLARVSRRLTQQDVGDLFDVSFQQIQKYETGANRISSDKLWVLARSLNVPIAFFFKDLPHTQATSEFDREGISPPLSAAAMRLGLDYDCIESRRVRASMARLASSLASLKQR